MEILNKFFRWLTAISPTWLRAAIIGISALLTFLLTFSSCGTTRAVVHTSDSGMSSITITTNNPIDVSTTPDINIELPTKNH